ncbi:MAG TPA: ETC complex I subunit [Acetobacteraceae bacterium]|nr:ETC complex I subunit [Acetobacteraceae bacterium]
MRARIYLPPKSAMQSGWAKTHKWVLEYEPESAKLQDGLMGWVGSDDPHSQIRLSFDTREEAVAYAEREGIAYDLELPTSHVRKPKSYADNFRFDRRSNWTH